jgi:hypothetical protein
LAQKIKVQKYLLKQQLSQAMTNVKQYENAYKQLVQRYNDLLTQARQLNQSCNMQALLLASIIKENAGKMEVKHDTMNSFSKSRLTIDAKADEARAVQMLSYEATPIPQEELDRIDAMQKQMAEAQAKQAEAELAAIPECTDPDCNLPKDLKHRHEPKQVAPPPDMTFAGPDGMTPETTVETTSESA